MRRLTIGLALLVLGLILLPADEIYFFFFYMPAKTDAGFWEILKSGIWIKEGSTYLLTPTGFILAALPWAMILPGLGFLWWPARTSDENANEDSTVNEEPDDLDDDLS